MSIVEKDNQKAIEMVKNGGIVIFPTDTAFGMGCRIDDERAVKRLFEIRRRPKTQATPVLVDSIEMAEEYVEDVSEEVIEKLMKPFWPGGLTIVLHARIDKVPKLVRGGGDTLGVRMPDHKIALEIIKGVGGPVLGPSANFHGEKTPFEFEDIDKNLIQLVDFVVTGECTIKKPSTVVDCTQKKWRVIRQGAVNIKL